MSENLPTVAEFSDPVTVPENGDSLNAESAVAALRALKNRTDFLLTFDGLSSPFGTQRDGDLTIDDDDVLITEDAHYATLSWAPGATGRLVLAEGAVVRANVADFTNAPTRAVDATGWYGRSTWSRMFSAAYLWRVPPGVTALPFVLGGAGGGGGHSGPSAGGYAVGGYGGAGGKVAGVLAVTPGQELLVAIGAGGEGGSVPGSGVRDPAGGGGPSVIYSDSTANTFLVIAGGGGGGGGGGSINQGGSVDSMSDGDGGVGGQGGGTVGGDGGDGEPIVQGSSPDTSGTIGRGGNGGTASGGGGGGAGGAFITTGSNGPNGATSVGGPNVNGGGIGGTNTLVSAGGRGGGGYYGGGGGGAGRLEGVGTPTVHSPSGGGGGGSSYAAGSVSSLVHTQGGGGYGGGGATNVAQDLPGDNGRDGFAVFSGLPVNLPGSMPVGSVVFTSGAGTVHEVAYGGNGGNGGQATSGSLAAGSADTATRRAKGIPNTSAVFAGLGGGDGIGVGYTGPLSIDLQGGLGGGVALVAARTLITGGSTPGPCIVADGGDAADAPPETQAGGGGGGGGGVAAVIYAYREGPAVSGFLRANGGAAGTAQGTPNGIAGAQGRAGQCRTVNLLTGVTTYDYGDGAYNSELDLDA